jgi:hypothetical protein
MNAHCTAERTEKYRKDAEEEHYFRLDLGLSIHHGTEIRKHTKAPIMYGNSIKRYIVIALKRFNNNNIEPPHIGCP